MVGKLQLGTKRQLGGRSANPTMEGLPSPRSPEAESEECGVSVEQDVRPPTTEQGPGSPSSVRYL